MALKQVTLSIVLKHCWQFCCESCLNAFSHQPTIEFEPSSESVFYLFTCILSKIRICNCGVTPQNGFKVVHEFSYQNGKGSSILNCCQLAHTHFIILTSHHSEGTTTHHSIHLILPSLFPLGSPTGIPFVYWSLHGLLFLGLV